jgi:separase
LKKVSRTPPALLWGCSSARLKRCGIHDPYGHARSLLQAGSFFVVGNLWDVTDKDLDNLSMECMDLFLNGSVQNLHEKSSKENDETLNDNQNDERAKQIKFSNANISHCVNTARSVCKLQHAVGCAPVVYGVPLKFF